MSPTSLPAISPAQQLAAMRSYALARMELGPAAHTVHYAGQALMLGATDEEVGAGFRSYLDTDGLRVQADEHVAAVTR